MIIIKNIRQNEIINILKENRSVKTADLAAHFGVTFQTVRRDLKQLEDLHLINKSYGGAMLVENNISPDVQPIESRRSSLQDIKHNMAALALDYISDNSTIALDAGSTMFELCKLLSVKKNLVILTSDIHLASELLTDTDHKVYMIGGFLSAGGVSEGAYAKEFLNQIASIDVFLFSSDGVTVEDGLMDDYPNINELKKMFLSKAANRIALVDHSKFGKKYFYKLCDFNNTNCIITDRATGQNTIDAISAHGASVMTV